MRTDLLAYTENHARGGANRYLIEIINILSTEFNKITLLSNKSGIYPEEINKLSKNITHKKMNLLSSTFLLVKITTKPKFKRHLKKILTLIIKISTPLIFAYQIVFFLSILIKEKPRRVIIFNGGYPGASSSLIFTIVSRLFTKKVSMCVVSMPIQRKKFSEIIESKIDKLVWSCCDLVISNCEAISKSLQKLRNLPKTKKVKVIFMGLKELPNFASRNEKVKLPNQELKFGYIGRLEKSKGIWILIEAFRQLLLVNENLKLEIFGEGPEKEAITNSLFNLGIEAKVKVYGQYFGQVQNILEDIDVFVSPSLWEGFPITITEAMRSGVAIIATNIGGVSEAVTDLKSGLLIPVNSISSLSQAMQLLIDNRQLRLNLGNAAREMFLERFIYDNFRSQVLDTYINPN